MKLVVIPNLQMRKLRTPELGHSPKIIHSACARASIQTLTSCSVPSTCHNDPGNGNQPLLRRAGQVLSVGGVLSAL